MRIASLGPLFAFCFDQRNFFAMLKQFSAFTKASEKSGLSKKIIDVDLQVNGT